MSLILKLLLNALFVLVVAFIVPGISVTSFYTAIIVALLLAAVNVTLKPILIILTLPINILTLGLFTFVINAFLLWFIATFVEGFQVRGFLAALIGSFLLALFSSLSNKLLTARE
jgi:putative membrane protein